VTPEASERVEALYKTFVKGELLKTNARTAEMVKLVENSYRDVNIAFANELSLMADAMDINVWELIALANHHPRVKILQPGCGVGGHCIAVDPWFLVSAHPEIAQVIHAGRRTNDGKPHWVAGKVAARAASLGRPAKIACLGLAYKPDIDDFRESPALEIFHRLAAQGLEVRAVEPYAEPGNPPNVSLISLSEAVEECDILVGLVPHAAFKAAGLPAEKLMDFCGMAR
jgi:UDP-N-acetyl-D-mannosaminuronic acid dehydrogenase